MDGVESRRRQQAVFCERQQGCRSPGWLGHLLGLLGADAEVADLAGAAPGGETEGEAVIDVAGAKGEVAAFEGGVDEEALVDGDADVVGADAELDAVPLVVDECHFRAGFIHGGVVVVDIGDADEAAAPAAEDE